MYVGIPALLGLCFRSEPTRGMHDTSYQAGRYVCRYAPQNATAIWSDLQVELLGLLAADLLHLGTTLTPLRGYSGTEPLSVEKVRAAIAQLQNPHHLPIGMLLDPTGLRQLHPYTDGTAPFALNDVRLMVVDTPYFPVHVGVHTGAIILLPETEAAHKATFHSVPYPFHAAGFPYQQEIRFPWGSLRCGHREGRAQGKTEFRMGSADHFFVGGEGVTLPYSE